MATVILKEFYGDLSNKEKKEFRRKLTTMADLSEAAFYVKLREGRWRKLERVLIASLIDTNENEVVFD